MAFANEETKERVKKMLKAGDKTKAILAAIGGGVDRSGYLQYYE